MWIGGDDAWHQSGRPFPTWPARMVPTAGRWELQVANGYIQWRYQDGSWAKACSPLSALEGVDGKDGITPQLRINPTPMSGRCPMMKVQLVSLGVSATGQDGQDGREVGCATTVTTSSGNMWT